MPTQLDPFKAAQRDIWSAGEYADLSPHIADVGERVIGLAEIVPGMRLLDIACGTGNAAIPAARAGAIVTAVDLTPKLLDAGRARAATAGVDIVWREGDAEALPFEDHTFDRVVSTFGHMFAPRHQRAADEMARVCRPGGVIVLATWTPEGVVGELFRASAAYLPPPPEYASPPILWGREDHVREMFKEAVTSLRFERHVNRIDWESLESFAEFFLSRFGPFVTARAMMGDRFGELRARVLDIWRRANEATDGRLRLPQEYLVSVIHV
jgi:ubiquinone/menaquinone biosynthesis C-methylase UbiE